MLVYFLIFSKTKPFVAWSCGKDGKRRQKMGKKMWEKLERYEKMKK
jgi:hypothetical protein